VREKGEEREVLCSVTTHGAEVKQDEKKEPLRGC
jgi:hypothetical protein